MAKGAYGSWPEWTASVLGRPGRDYINGVDLKMSWGEFYEEGRAEQHESWLAAHRPGDVKEMYTLARTAAERYLDEFHPGKSLLPHFVEKVSYAQQRELEGMWTNRSRVAVRMKNSNREIEITGDENNRAWMLAYSIEMVKETFFRDIHEGMFGKEAFAGR